MMRFASCIVGNATIHQCYLPTDVASDVAFMGDKHDRLPLPNQVSKQIEHRVSSPGIEVASRFISNDERRIIGQSPRNRRTLLLTS
ncbi:hypothetical protein KSF_104550 [Reticulibacter mediterranei]|uniref:Uncharacterized protein n=1 Tax=Reticulibacter mediterranei TaxID=2778369 RepID=A0A8J3J138_9CHLR|nr:hypothetical protein KSF_104550 [Reticulibacter mediterranei]